MLHMIIIHDVKQTPLWNAMGRQLMGGWNMWRALEIVEVTFGKGTLVSPMSGDHHHHMIGELECDTCLMIIRSVPLTYFLFRHHIIIMWYYRGWFLMMFSDDVPDGNGCLVHFVILPFSAKLPPDLMIQQHDDGYDHLCSSLHSFRCSRRRIWSAIWPPVSAQFWMWP